MELLYILTLILLGTSFIIFKKSDEKLNFIKWLIIFIVSLFGYNILLGMVLGLLNITSQIWLLSLINTVFACLLGYKAVTKKEVQKYFVRKIDVVTFILLLAIFTVMFVKDLYIFNGDISHMAIDSAIHYRAAKHYSENLKIFINVEDKTFFNFNVMQPGAYINDGIFMRIVNGITGIDHTMLYQVFETMVLFLSGLAFYSSFIDKIKTKKGLIATLVLFALYIYGYPYNAWFYGFSYLAVGIMFVAILIPIVEAIYENIDKKIVLMLLVLTATGLIFSYCLFVPAIFAGICIYCFLKDFTVEGKTYLKFFKKTTLIVTGLLLLVTAAGIGYLLIPTFFIAGQTNLFSALKIEGAIYSEKIDNFIPFIPFAVMYIFEIIKRIKEKSLRYMDIFTIIITGFLALLYLGALAGKVSWYYMLKIYFIMWMVIFTVVIDLVNENIDSKNIKIDIIIFFALYILFLILPKLPAVSANPNHVFRKIDNKFIFKTFLVVGLICYTVIPKFFKKFDFQKICISGAVYVMLWGAFVFGWTWTKSGHLIGEAEKHSLPNLIGMYFSENCNYRKLVDLTQNFNKNQIELATFARENIEDLNADNIEIMTSSCYYTRVWATAVLEVNSEKIRYENFIQDMTPYTANDVLKDESKKYIVKLVSRDLKEMTAYKEELEETKKMEQIEILFENENGYVAKINR